MEYRPEGKTYAPDDVPNALYNVVTPGFFDAFGLTIVSGRAFDQRDGMDAPRTAIVSRSFADREWPGENPVGKRLHLSSTDSTWTTVVGVVNSFVQDRRIQQASVRPQVLVPFAQTQRRALSIAVRSTSDDPLPSVRSFAPRSTAWIEICRLRRSRR